jgi:uncharacterized Zn finger protein
MPQREVNMTKSDGPPLAELASPERIADLADSTTMREGSTLADTDSVDLVEVTPFTVRATVHDNEGDVDVSLASSQSGLKTWCSCGAEGTVCRHAAATALRAWHQMTHGGQRHTTEL